MAEEALKRACCSTKDGSQNADHPLWNFCFNLVQSLNLPGGDQVSLAKNIENGLRQMGWDDENVAEKCKDIRNALREVEKLLEDKKVK